MELEQRIRFDRLIHKFKQKSNLKSLKHIIEHINNYGKYIAINVMSITSLETVPIGVLSEGDNFVRVTILNNIPTNLLFEDDDFMKTITEPNSMYCGYSFDEDVCYFKTK